MRQMQRLVVRVRPCTHTDSAVVFSTLQSSFNNILAMKSALKSTALTTTCLACKRVHRWAHCTELLHTHIVELHGLLSCMHEYYQYSERVAILHSLHMRSEHVVSQELHSTDYTQARCKKVRDQGVKLMWSCRLTFDLQQ